jgi:hypothetical protein
MVKGKKKLCEAFEKNKCEEKECNQKECERKAKEPGKTPRNLQRRTSGDRRSERSERNQRLGESASSNRFWSN